LGEELGDQEGRVLAQVVWISACLADIPARPPETKAEPVREVIHGVEVTDPYRWLEDQHSSETRAWIDAQNAYTDSLLGPLPHRSAIAKRLGELTRTDTITLPIRRAEWCFFSKRLAAQDLFVICRRRGIRGKEEVLIDPHPMSPDHTVSVSMLDVSKDGRLLVYGVRQGGADEIELRIMDVESRRDLPDRFPTARYTSVAILPDGVGLYYATHSQKDGPRVYYHRLGADCKDDSMVFGEGLGPDKIVGADLSEDGRCLLLTVFHGTSTEKTEVYYVDLKQGGGVRTLVDDVDAAFYGQAADGRVYLHTNWHAANGRILCVDLETPERDKWREVVPATDAVLRGFALAGGRIVADYLVNVHSVLKVFDRDGSPLREIPLPAVGSVGGLTGRWDSDEVFFSFSSFHMPTTIYRYDLEAGKRSAWARVKVPLRKPLVVKQVWYTSKDGTRVPMFLMHAKGLKRDGRRPVYLTGYGGFNISLTPGFGAVPVLWAEAGGVFAMPNLRGGGEFGEQWHRAGMREKKQNVFDDFIAAAEWLIENGYTNPSRLAISGGSNGGLLVGAAVTQRPDLFRAAVCAYPLLDMVRYHKMLVGSFWIPEYGSADDPEQFRYLLGYSPYHHVRKGAVYPAVLFVTGDVDTRVDPMHARKMTALLQASAGSDRPILLMYDTKAGHSGGKPLSKWLEDESKELAFLFWQLGIPDGALGE